MQLHERVTLEKKNKKFMYTVYFIFIIYLLYIILYIYFYIKTKGSIQVLIIINKSNNNYCNKISITGCVILKLLLININIVIEE